MLYIDYENCLDIKLGDNKGISLKDIQNLQPISDKFFNYFQNNRKNKFYFLDVIYQDISEIEEFAKEIRENYKYFVHVGIGGSSLGTEMLFYSLKGIYHNLNSYPKFFVLDNVDIDKIEETLNLIDIEKTFFYVVSKSGNTLETLTNLSVILERVKNLPNWEKHFAIATSNRNGRLYKFATKHNIKTLHIPENIGGRFSVLTNVGILPSLVLSIDVKEILEGAKFVDKNFLCRKNILENPSLLLGSVYYLYDTVKNKSISVIMPYSEKLSYFVDWFRQLWAESLGKNGLGQTPVKSLGTQDQHSQFQLYMDGRKDKIITFLSVKNKENDVCISDNIDSEISFLSGHSVNEIFIKEMEGIKLALTKRGVPNLTLTLEKLTPFEIGKLILIFELATGYAGYLYKINPFDQPAVEEGKKYIYELLNKQMEEKENFVLKV